MRYASSSVALAMALLTGCPLNNGAVTSEYARQVTVASAASAELGQSLVDAERRVQQLENIVRERGNSETQALENLDQVDAELRAMRGRIEEMQFALDDLREAQEQFLRDLEFRQLYAEARLKQVEGYLGVEPPPPPAPDGVEPENPEDPDTKPEEPELPASVEEKLESAMEHMREDRQRLARVLLEKAIEVHAGSELLPEVRYRLAETWFNEGKFGNAVGYFQRVIENHRKSDWAAWSMLRQGECFERLGKPDKAKVFYQQLMRVYPGTPAAKEAKKALSR